MVARILGSISIDRFKEIISKLKIKHPLLSSRIIFDEKNIAWLINENVDEIPIIEKIRTKEDDWIEILIKEQKHIFPLQNGPLIRFIVIKGSNSFDLIINCHHAISDGLSIAYLIHDIIYHLSNEEEEIKNSLYPPQINKNTIPLKTSSNLLTKFLIKIVNYFWKKGKTTFGWNDYKKLTKKFWEHNSCGIIPWQLSNSQTLKLIDNCKREGVTVNSALCTAFLASKYEIGNENNPINYKIHIPINIRDRLTEPVSKAFGFYAQTLFFDLEYNPNLSFWELTRIFNKKIHSEMYNDKKVFNLSKLELLDPSLLDSTYYQKYDLFSNKWSDRLLKTMGANDLIADLSITNLGKLNFPTKYGKFSLDALYGPSVFCDILETIVGVSTIGNKMNFIITFNEKYNQKNLIIKMKKVAMAYLARACNW
jgi:NRPS condensation-like uncharacterized protein